MLRFVRNTLSRFLVNRPEEQNHVEASEELTSKAPKKNYPAPKTKKKKKRTRT